jgi:putative FmdB family regulatory protein
MPLYTYECRRHGVFSDWRSMKECHLSMPCPICEALSERQVSVPHRGMDSALYKGNAINEKSAHEPRVVRRRRGDGIPAHDTHRDLTHHAHLGGSHSHAHGEHSHQSGDSSTVRSHHPWLVRH